jgi:hypothetical protein
MNNPDFFHVSASGPTISSLMKLPNVKRENIEVRLYHESGKEPRRFYKVKLAYFDVMEFGRYFARKLADDMVTELVSARPEDVIFSVGSLPRK